jgi:hypothetical protein
MFGSVVVDVVDTQKVHFSFATAVTDRTAVRPEHFDFQIEVIPGLFRHRIDSQFFLPAVVWEAEQRFDEVMPDQMFDCRQTSEDECPIQILDSFVHLFICSFRAGSALRESWAWPSPVIRVSGVVAV